MSLLDKGISVPDIPKHLITVIYGAPGVGKTILAARTANKTAIITDERSYVALSEFPELAANCTVYPWRDYDHMTALIRELYSGDHNFDHLLIDTFGGIIRKKLEEQRKKVTFNRGHGDINSLEDYNLLNNHMFDLIGRLVKLPMSVTLTAHDLIPSPEQYAKGDKVLRASIPFRVFECLNGYANILAYMQMNKDGVRRVFLTATDKFEAKNHLKMPSSMSDDDFVKTVRNWKGI